MTIEARTTGVTAPASTRPADASPAVASPPGPGSAGPGSAGLGSAGPGPADLSAQRAMWALGDYPAVARDLISGLGERLVRACGVRPGDRVLDVAAGAGNAAIPAALAGARVTACDLTPELLDAGRAAAVGAGADVAWREADARSLPFPDGAFDVVLSCVGVMFAPDHQACASELLRVCRPGGTIGLLSWTPEGFIGQMLAVTRQYLAPPPPGARPAPWWGRPGYLSDLLAGRVTDVAERREMVRIDRFAGPAEFCDYFKARYGPTIAAYRQIAADPERVAGLDRDLAGLARGHDLGVGPSLMMDWEYLLVTARRPG